MFRPITEVDDWVPCKECGKSFNRKHVAQKLCSDKCKRAAKNKNHKKWRKENPDKIVNWSRARYDRDNGVDPKKGLKKKRVGT